MHLYFIVGISLLLWTTFKVFQFTYQYFQDRRLLAAMPDGQFPSGPPSRERYLHEFQELLFFNYEKYTKHDRIFKLPNNGGNYRIILPIRYLKEIKLATGRETLSWQKNMHDVLAIKDTGNPDRAPFSAKVLRTQVTKRLDLLAENMLTSSIAYFDETLPKSGEKARSVEIHEAFLGCIAAITVTIFCGEELARDEDWVEACKEFTIDAWAAGAETRKFGSTTRWLKSRSLPEVKRMVNHKALARKKIYPIYKERIAKRDDPNAKASEDGFQWLLDGAGPETDFETFCQTLMRVMMAALHTSASMATLAFADLLYRPQYINDIVTEIKEHMVDSKGELTHNRRDCEDLVKLDSFIKESARFNPIGLAAAGRKIVGKPHVFSDGTTIPPGNTLFAPGGAIHMDPKIYPEPEEFKPWRFAEERAKGAGEDKRWLLANATEESFNFGYGAQACPGRFFASQEIKLMFATLLMRYDTKWDEAKNGKEAPRGARMESGLLAPTEWHMLVSRKEGGSK